MRIFAVARRWDGVFQTLHCRTEARARELLAQMPSEWKAEVVQRDVAWYNLPALLEHWVGLRTRKGKKP